MNLSYVDWYLVELRRHVRESVRLEDETSLIAETKNHLESLVEELQSQGLDAEKAQLAAIERFGAPKEISRRFIEAAATKDGRKIGVGEVVVVALCLIAITFGMIMMPFDQGYGVTAIACSLVVLLGIFTLFSGRMPNRRTIGIYAAFPIMIGVVSALFFSYHQTSPTGKPEVFLNQEVGQLVAKLEAQNKDVTSAEDRMIARWKEIEKDPKLANGLSAGQTISIPGYKHKGGKGVYVMCTPKNGESTYVCNGTEKISIGRTDVDFGAIVDRSPDVFKGPLTASEFRHKMDDQINRAGWQRKYRSQALDILASTNGHYVEKFGFFAGYSTLAVWFVAIPSSLLFSLLMLKIHRLIRFRTRKMKLA